MITPHLEPPHTKLRNLALSQGPLQALVVCRAMCPGQGQAPRCRSLGLAGSRFFFLTGRAVTDNKSDDLGCMRAVSTSGFFFAFESTITGSFFLNPVPAVPSAACWFCLGVPFRLFFPHSNLKNKIRCLLQWLPRGRRSRTWRGCWAPVGLNWNPLYHPLGHLLTFRLAGSAGIAELAIFHPVRSPDDCASRTPM